MVDIADCTEAPPAGRRARPRGARYILNGATITSAEALELISEVSGIRENVRIVPPVVARSAAALLEAASAVRGRTTSLCRARIRTWLHGHRYDGSLAARELGLELHARRRDLPPDDRMGRRRGARHETNTNQGFDT